MLLRRCRGGFKTIDDGLIVSCHRSRGGERLDFPEVADARDDQTAVNSKCAPQFEDLVLEGN